MKPEEYWIQRVRKLLQAALPDSVEVARDRPGRHQPDLIVSSAGSVVLIELKLARGPRISEVEGLFAKAVLSLRRQAASRKQVLVAIVAISRFGKKLEQAVREYMEEFAPDIGWGLVDALDQSVLEIPELGVEVRHRGSLRQWDEPDSARRDRQLFTDLNRWMLKVLLLRNAPKELWGGPRHAPAHPTELAEIAQVSVSKAHRFASAFHAEGFLRKTKSGLRLVRVDSLLEVWLQDERYRSPRTVHVRPLVPSRDSPSSEQDWSGESQLPRTAWGDAVLGGGIAAEIGDLLRIVGSFVPLVHVKIPFSNALQDWSLERCDTRDAQFVLNRPLYPRSVFSGEVHRRRGAPVVDVWQIALDSVRTDPRGLEQADYIVQRVIALQEAE
jgi:hypothetical protein